MLNRAMPNRASGLVLSIFLLCAAAGAQEDPTPIAILNTNVVDTGGGPTQAQMHVIVSGKHIVEVGKADEVQVPEGARRVDGRGRFLIPGLWDMHVHLMINGHTDYDHWDRTYPDRFESVIMPASAKQLLLAGVTSARDLGAPLDASIAVRDAINAGEIPGPTLYVSGPFIQKQPYPGTDLFRWGVDGAEDARRKVAPKQKKGPTAGLQRLDRDQTQGVIDQMGQDVGEKDQTRDRMQSADHSRPPSAAKQVRQRD